MKDVTTLLAGSPEAQRILDNVVWRTWWVFATRQADADEAWQNYVEAV